MNFLNLVKNFCESKYRYRGAESFWSYLGNQTVVYRPEKIPDSISWVMSTYFQDPANPLPSSMKHLGVLRRPTVGEIVGALGSKGAAILFLKIVDKYVSSVIDKYYGHTPVRPGDCPWRIPEYVKLQKLAYMARIGFESNIDAAVNIIKGELTREHMRLGTPSIKMPPTAQPVRERPQPKQPARELLPDDVKSDPDDIMAAIRAIR